MPATASAPILTDAERARARSFCAGAPARTALPAAALPSAAECARARSFCGTDDARPRPLAPGALFHFVSRLNAEWDDVDALARRVPPARRPELYRPHNGVPRAITLDHWWRWERTDAGWRICNIRTGQTAHVRAAA